MNKNKGFTLIELLVVIAIIGILSSVVLASLSSARTKGQIAAIESTMSSLRAQAEVGMSNGKYVKNVCTVDSAAGGLDTLLKSITNSTTNTAAKGTSMKCGQDTAATDQPYKWGAEIVLPTSSATPVGTIWCSDSTGFSGIIGTTPKITDGVGAGTAVSCQ